MSTNKQALREAAEKAIGAHERLSIMPSDDIFDISLAEGTQLDADVTAMNAFNDAAKPATVLALLNELEAKEEQRANWFQMAEKLGADLDAAEKRNAELEAREIKLPQRYSMLYRTEFDAPYDSLMAFKESDVIEVLAAAGITVKGE